MSAWEWAEKAVVHSMTGIDGKTVDPARLIGYGSCVTGLVTHTAGAVVMLAKGTFDLMIYSTSFAALSTALVAAALGVRAKGDSEPKA